jgi:hypothetical protein
VQKLSQKLISPRHMALASPSEALWRIRLRWNPMERMEQALECERLERSNAVERLERFELPPAGGAAIAA